MTDPNAVLDEIRLTVHNVGDWEADVWADMLPQWSVQLAVKIEELDAWLTKGGQPPGAWTWSSGGSE
jgi:hypothetical protein